MTVQDLIPAMGLTVFHLAQPERSISGGYVGDLLSWVMGRAGQDCAWLTIMSNQNVAAVALMADVSCVILTEGVQHRLHNPTDTDAIGLSIMSGMTF